jgi:predicted aspartyl protease
MKHRCLLAAALVAAALACASGPSWADCTMTTLTLPVTMDGMKPTVPAKVNGKDARFEVDSGSFYNGISAQFAQDQKMKAATIDHVGSHVPGQAATEFVGVGGREKAAALVRANEFVLGGSAIKDVAFISFPGLTGEDGLIGQNILGVFDVEYDFGHATMKFVAAKGCKEANLAYWAKPGTAYSVMPMDWDPDRPGTRGTIWINGIKMTALFDTGADVTFITQRAAVRAGVKVTDPGVKEAGYSSGLDRDRIKTWSGRFASVKIGDEEIRNGLLSIGETSADDFDVLVGADFFLSHHVLASNSQKKIYFTYEGGQVFSVSGKARPGSAEGAADGDGR